MIKPGETIRLDFDPPIDVGKQAVLITPNPAQVVMQSTTDTVVQLTNQGVAAAPYLVGVVPELLVRAAVLPWGRLLEALKR